MAKTKFDAGQELAILGDENSVDNFSKVFALERIGQNRRFSKLYDTDRSGFAEVIVPSRSELGEPYNKRILTSPAFCS
jgi:hypothetical protein